MTKNQNKTWLYGILAVMALAIAGAATQITQSDITVAPPTGAAMLIVDSTDGGSVLDLRAGSTNNAAIYMRNGTDFVWKLKVDYAVARRYEMDNASGTTGYYLTQAGDAWVRGDMSAQSFTDRTVGPANSVKALTELKKIRTSDDCLGNKCEIDKDTLPKEMTKEYIDEETNQTRKARDLTYTVSWLIKANQELLARVEALEQEVEALR